MADAIVLEPAATTDGSEDKVSFDEQSATYISSDLKNLDVALSIAAHHTDERDLDPREACRLRRKIDWHIIPLLCAIYTGTLFIHCFYSNYFDNKDYSAVHRQVSFCFDSFFL